MADEGTCMHEVLFEIHLHRTPIVWWGPDTLAFFTVYNTQQDPVQRPHGEDPGPLKWGDHVYVKGVKSPQPYDPCSSPLSPLAMTTTTPHEAEHVH